MDAIAFELAMYLMKRLESTPTGQRLLIGIAGIPASGKSTLGILVVNHINTLLKTSSQSESLFAAVLIGLDGWHLTRAQLDAFPDPRLAHDRRGAHWTFDGEAYVAFVKLLRAPLISTHALSITAPTFDHVVKDPVPSAVNILPIHRIVIIEGLYTFLSVEPWVEAGKLLDERWFVDVDIEKAKERLIKRHVITGVGKDLEDSVWRAEENDMPNGRFIIEHMLEPTRRITSVEDPVFTVHN